jgi:Na+:H+ antiporter
LGFETAVVLLFAVATAVALIARWLRVPYTVALVAAGLALGAAHAFEAPHLTKDLLFAVFLPGLLFEAAFHLRFEKFWENKKAVLALAVPGVAAATALTAFVLTPSANALHFVEGFTLGQGLVFGALIAATDPIAVVALFKTLGVPKRLSVLVEAESLLNDGTAAVVFSLIVGLALGGQATVPEALLHFLTVVGLGTLVGILVSLAASKVIQRVDDPMIEITLTMIAAYGSFVLAEELHASGVIATVAAGMVCGNYAARTGMSPSTVVAVESFWEYLAFALNSLVFLLIGFEVKTEALIASWEPILVAYGAATLGRALVIFLVAALLQRSKERIPWRWAAVLTWGGLRGGLSMVLVLGLTRDFPNRDLLVTMTFGVVILSIVLQGLSMVPLLRRFGLVAENDEWKTYEKGRAASGSLQAALRALDLIDSRRLAQPDIVNSVRADYEQRSQAAQDAVGRLHLEREGLRAYELEGVRRQVLLAQKEHLLESLHKGLVSQEAYESLAADIDAELLALRAGEIPG